MEAYLRCMGVSTAGIETQVKRRQRACSEKLARAMGRSTGRVEKLDGVSTLIVGSVDTRRDWISWREESDRPSANVLS